MISFITTLPIVILIGYLIILRGKYKNKSNAGAFFFENDSLVLNTGIPYPIPISEIDYVELNYNSWELEHKLSYGLFVKVVRKNGKSKKVFYKGYRTAKRSILFPLIGCKNWENSV
ncbi:MAG: hypothetical protein J1E64_01760 [Acetatifactor sp.]|nr:hypothetical protein [Acetatifactor sp.]